MTDDQTPKTPVSAPPARTQATADLPSGNWVLWSCILLALCWWGATGSLAWVQAEALNFGAMPLPTKISLGLIALTPGVVLVLVGLVARQSVRSRAANALILQAATQLLSPASAATSDIASLAEATRQSTRDIDQTTSDALASMKTMHEALSAERLRAESVSYAMADNARELSERLAEERKGLEVLTKAMDAQANMMREVIPQQSAAMVAAAKAASEEVGAADDALQARLNQLKQAGSTLAVRLTDLDAIAKDAAERTDGLVQSITAIEEKLSRSDKTIERAEQSSSMAVEAANSVGAALQQAVSSALDGARAANEEITQISRKLQEDAAHSITELRVAALDASDGLPAAPSPRPQPQQAPPPQEPVLQQPSPANAPLPPPTAKTAADSDLFDQADLNGAAPQIHVHPAHAPATPTDPEAGWSDIISDLDSEQSANQAAQVEQMERDEIAKGLIGKLEGSGIELPSIFRPRDKKKIAAASRKSAEARRAATRSAGGQEVTRVSNRLRKDSELNALAHAFVDMEHVEALQALADTSGTPRPASPRLAAFLLADAALTVDD